MKLLILDASYENTLAIVRHLGKNKSIEISAVSNYRFSLSFFSKYCNHKFIVENPNTNEALFLKQLLAILKDKQYDLLMPVGYKTYKICVANQVELKKHTHLIVPSIASFNIAIDKVACYKLAEKLGLGFPLSWQPKSIEEINTVPIKFPVVIKSPQEIGKSAVSFVYSKAHFKKVFHKIVNQYKSENIQLPLIQELIEGTVYCFSAYYENGICKAYYMHYRIREFPINVGASVCAESCYDEELLRCGKKLLDDLNWNGVAIIEFKKDKRDGVYKLIEINPKFWSGIELAILSGVNYPYYLIQNIKGEEISYNSNYKKVRFQWILYGEFFHFIYKPWTLFYILRDLFRSKNDIWFSDIKPNLIQVLIIPFQLYKKIIGK